ncbi:MAG: DUF4340 domain-containing protein [Phycisphaerales bacterium]|nr:MAG: DUF4340 domain-containing protein [Phycisphaerales bacterium]
MNNQKLAVLGIVAAALVIWAVAQSRISNTPRIEPGGPAYLIPGLDTAGIGSVVLGTGDDEVTLKRDTRGFVVTNKDNYAADVEQINDLITKCLDIQIGGLYTHSSDNHKDLGVTEEDARTLVKFHKPDESLLVGFAVGKDRELGQGVYVRLLPGDNVYISEREPWIRKRAVDYIEQEITAVQRDNLESVAVTSPAGEYLLTKKEDSEDLVLQNVPEGKQLKQSDAKSVFTALTSLRFDDVKKESAASDLKFDTKYVCKLKDSTIYTLNVAKDDEKTYVTCQVEFTDTTPVTMKKGEVESDEELKKKEAKLLARDKAKEFAGKHAGWVYEIPDWKAKNLTKPLADLLEDKQEEPEKAEDEKPAEPKPGEQESGEAADATPKPDEPTPEPTDQPAEPNAVKTEE